MPATCVFIGCDVMLLDLFLNVWILIVGGGEENIKVLLEKQSKRLQVKTDERTAGVTLKNIPYLKLTCRWAIALNMMRLFSHSMLLRASSAGDMKPGITVRFSGGCSQYLFTLSNTFLVCLYNFRR